MYGFIAIISNDKISSIMIKSYNILEVILFSKLIKVIVIIFECLLHVRQCGACFIHISHVIFTKSP